MTSERKARICWVNKRTGLHGAGSHIFTEKAAMILIQQLNDEFPHIEHRLSFVEEPETEPPKNL